MDRDVFLEKKTCLGALSLQVNDLKTISSSRERNESTVICFKHSFQG